MITRNIKKRRPNFTKGMARVLDLGSTINRYIYNDDSEEIDSKAMRSDWEMVGEDIKLAINNYQRDFHGRSKRKFDN